jgi:plasmid stabilization system protein ParE
VTRRQVRFTATAQEHVRFLKRWWLENSSHPEILLHDLDAAVKLLSIAPGIGSVYRASPIPGIRRFYLERLTCHLYYTYDQRELVVRAVWHVRRGSAPELGSG